MTAYFRSCRKLIYFFIVIVDMVTDNFNSKITMVITIAIAIDFCIVKEAITSSYYNFPDFFAEYPIVLPASFPCSRRCMTWV